MALNRYLKLLDSKDCSNINSGINIKVSGNIEFKNVWFSYPNKKVLDDISFNIEKNIIVAFVGKIVDNGTYDNLIKNNEYFKKLAKKRNNIVL